MEEQTSPKALEQSFRRLKLSAQDAGLSQLLDSFNVAFITYCLEHFASALQVSLDDEQLTKQTLERLQACQAAFRKLSEHASQMDVELFKRLLFHNKCFQACGTTPSGGRVFFIRSGKLDNGIWSVRYKSPEWHSRVLAMSWGILVSVAQDPSYLQNPTSALVVCDERERGCLDINYSLISAALALQKDLLPVPCSAVFVGLGRVITTIWRVLESFFPEDSRSWDIIGEDEIHKIHTFVKAESENEPAAPEWFWEGTEWEGTGAAYDLRNRRNYFCVERLLHGEELTPRDVFGGSGWFPWDEPGDTIALKLDEKELACVTNREDRFPLSPLRGTKEHGRRVRPVTPVLESLNEEDGEEEVEEE